MTDKPMLSFAKVVSGKTSDGQSDLGLMETVSDVTAASGSTTTQTGMNQQLTTTNNSGIKSPNKESSAANAQGKKLDKSRDMPNDKGARSERTGRKKTGRQKEKRRAERGSKTEEEKGKSTGDGKGGKKPGEAHNGGTEQAHAQQNLALEPAPLPAVNAWFRNKDAIVDSAAVSPKNETAPVQIQSPVDSKPLHGNNNSSGNGAQEHKHKQKPLDVKKVNNKKDDQRTHDRKEAKSGHHQQHGKGREGREREKETENRANHNMQQTMTVATEWPTLDAANSADEAMTNGNVQTEEQKEAVDRGGVGMKQQHAERTQQPSPHSEIDDYSYPENAGGIYYKQGASQGWKKNAKGIKEVIHNHNTPSPLPLPLPLHFQSSIPHPLINGTHHHEEQLNFVTATSHPHSTNISTMDSVQNKEPNEVHASHRHNPSSGRDEKPSQQQGINGTSGGQNATGGNTGRGQQHNMANNQQTRSGGRDRDVGRGQRHQGQNQKQHGPPSSGPINQRDYWHKKEHGGSSSSGPSGQSAPPPSLPTNQPPPVLQQPQHLISVGKPALQQPTAGHSSTPGGTQGNSADKQQPKPYYQNNDRSSQQQRVNPHAPPKLTPSQRKARGPLPDWDEIQDCEDTFDYMSLMDTQFAQFYPIHQSYDVAAAAAAVQAPQMGIMIQQATQHMAQFGYRPPLQMFPPVMAAAPATAAAAPPPHSLPPADPSTTLAAAGGPSLVPPPVITSTTPTPILPTAMLSPQPLGQINTAIPFAPIYPSTVPPFAAMSEDSLKEYARKQIEYYFSDENLQKDFFLRRKMSPDGFLPLTLIASFPRVRSLTENRALILDALRDSEKIEISPDNQHIRTRINPTAWPLAPTVPTAADSPSSASAPSSNTVTTSPSAVVSPVNKQPPAPTPAPAHSTTPASAPATVNANASVSTPQSVPSSSSAPPTAKPVEKDENKEQSEHPVDEAKPSSATGESHNEDEEEKWEQVSRKRKGKAARNEKPPQQQNEGGSGGGTQRSNEKGGGGQHNSSGGGSTRPRSKDDGSSSGGGVSSPS